MASVSGTRGHLVPAATHVIGRVKHSFRRSVKVHPYVTCIAIGLLALVPFGAALSAGLAAATGAAVLNNALFGSLMGAVGGVTTGFIAAFEASDRRVHSHGL